MANDKQNNIFDKIEIIKAILLMGFGILIVFGVSIALGNFNKDEPEKPSSERPIVSCPADFPSYQKFIEDGGNVVDLIKERTPMYAENGQFHSQIVITKIETEKSKVACGYLMVRAGTKTYGPIQSWENLYINPNEFGGHIDSQNNIGLGDSSEYSEYLFPLNKMNYWKTRNDRVAGNLLSADWGVLLNVSKTIGFDIGLNTNDKTGFIEKFSIAYKCWNPETGEENKDCKIEVLK